MIRECNLQVRISEQLVCSVQVVGDYYWDGGVRDNPPVSYAAPGFVFLPKVIQWGMKADAQAVIDTFGKNGQGKKVFWTLLRHRSDIKKAKYLPNLINLRTA